MARRISKQQQARISKARERRAEKARGNGDAELPAEGSLGPELEGRVIAHYGGQVDIRGNQHQQRCYLRTHLDDLVTGDRVVWRAGQDIGVVESILPRKSVLQRPDFQGRPRCVAANLDQICIVLASEPEAHELLLDRYLVAARLSELKAVIVHNKTDLPGAADLSERLQVYRQIGYPVVEASSRSQNGLSALRERCQNRVSVLAGQSGVGKSSLLNALLPDAEASVGALSQAQSKGRHTTTHSQWFDLPEGGSLIDSPGIREFGLDQYSEEQLARGFAEFESFLGHCRFRDCRHRDEPGCALIEAIESGDISEQRWQRFQHLRDAPARDQRPF